VRTLTDGQPYKGVNAEKGMAQVGERNRRGSDFPPVVAGDLCTHGACHDLMPEADAYQLVVRTCGEPEGMPTDDFDGRLVLGDTSNVGGKVVDPFDVVACR
jgi:hypothetical protein